MSAQVKKEANKVSAILSSYMIYLVLIIMVIAISILSGGKFLKITNILNVLRQVTITGTLAIGMTLVLITGGIDLSVGSVMAIAGVVAADLAHADGGIPLGASIMAGVGIGLLFGAANGVLIAYIKAPVFIVTLGYKVPEEAAFIGYDDIQACEACVPGLTSLRINNTELGKLAVKRLIGKIENSNQVALRVFVPATLVERDSVGDLSEGNNEVPAEISV